MPLRVAAYCRVSTDRDDQVNSLHSQQSFFRSYIENHEDWVLAEVYADEGISGTSTKNRTAFNRMIQDAKIGRLQLILTKEVSRFARNTVDTLKYTRQLQKLGVGVIFINDNIDTRENGGEFRLTIMASIAQEESRKTSERVKWGQKRRMEAGVVFGNKSIYGFHLEGGELSIKEEEASVVRSIYHKCLNEGKGTHVIARELYEEGMSPPQSSTGKWSSVMIRRILRNEKYVGDLVQKKFFTPDYLSHHKIENRGQEEKVVLTDHHEGIVDRATWEGVQKELARREGEKGDGAKYSNRYWCSGKIRCGLCKSRFILRTDKRKDGDIYKSWCCHSRSHYGNWKQNGQGDYVECDMRTINEKSLITCVQYVLQQLDLDFDVIITELKQDIQSLAHSADTHLTNERLLAQKTDIQGKKERVMDAYFSETISKEEMLQMKGKYDDELVRIELSLQKQAEEAHIRVKQTKGLEDMMQVIRERATCSQEVFAEVVEKIEVYQGYINIHIYYFPMVFQLQYSTSGKRAAYTTTIESCTLVAKGNV